MDLRYKIGVAACAAILAVSGCEVTYKPSNVDLEAQAKATVIVQQMEKYALLNDMMREGKTEEAQLKIKEYLFQTVHDSNYLKGKTENDVNVNNKMKAIVHNTIDDAVKKAEVSLK